jgi:hypothetical protein
MLNPSSGRIGWNFIPEQAASVAHSQYVDFSISIDVRRDNIVGPFYNGVGVFYKFLFSWFGCVSVPGGSGDLVYPAIAIHIESCSADIGWRFLAEQVSDPAIRAFIFEPPYSSTIASGNPV